MRTAIEVVWWLGLLGALVPTLVILKLAFLVVGRLREILRLAALTRDAAAGVAVHVAAVDELRGVGALVKPVDDALGAVVAPLAALGDGLGRLAGTEG
jgi:hypothetical protein